MYGVIMAGGGGTRFWPLSRANTPKQFLNITGEDTMINDTIKRIKSIVPTDKIIIVTNKIQKKMLSKVIQEDIPEANVLAEPVGRNTAACIGYAAMVIKKRCGDAVMGVFPSDHYIKDADEFQRVLNAAYSIAENTEKLVTIGINPTFPSTGYGYIKYDRERSIPAEGKIAYEVVDFVEKPNLAKAKEYLKNGNYLWNSGMFAWKASVILENFERFLPKLYRGLLELEPFIDTPKEKTVVEEIYPALQSISIDYGVMERSDKVVVIPGDFGWSDVGSWDSLGEVFPLDENGNITRGDFIAIDTRNSIIYSNSRLVAAVGLENMIVVETNDALLVCPKEKAQDVKKVVEQLKEMGRNELL
ncbi:Mannose-1-phosphate guanylyltransferase [Tepidanaerobacter acetatoxydans Re1]|uniref:mannose-1-phosphate guanylyltransferase n=1 Tax=Tepidanaerobacter acetatoxydans (strain DSM 21804 / JCM 16047 / Re1) TaxID=1209989 RepID=F4LVS8_TEPAE|nr:mannose-1-phosphate guanylyltransferase [Tepidanaerobacter acetatoxydans]AEE90775.1 Mannose-1-phosphate guanylyltransferase [Tepidanaerobacter acetatoxydans Re1]CCP25330.1 Mannose-1-phosphate guanylyltransferase [Tepidanaerobacter acetatoxydans Re1]